MKAAITSVSLALLVANTTPATAQTLPGGGNMVLIADRVYMTRSNLLVAEGHVEALQGDVRIRANRIEYNAKSDIVRVTGPIRLEQGDTVHVLASYAELNDGFRTALLKSARVVLDQQLQMASAQMNRIDGRYNVLHKTSVSSCKVCDDGRPPIWQIRAKRVVHDQEERQIYFDHAQFRILDMPVAYFPQMRLPDPTMERATGFLIPEINQNSELGFGFKVPYFITLGDHRDLRLTPYLAEHTNTLEFRYRQAFRNGGLEINGAVSDDSIFPNQPRFYGFIHGWQLLPRNYTLTYNVRATSDDAYLLEYDYSDLDRLESDITVRRIERDENTRFSLIHFESLRANENNNTIPSVVGIAETERRYFPTAIGGEARFGLQLHGHYRDADTGVNGLGRDVARATASVSWQRNWTLANGLRPSLSTSLAFDAFDTHQDNTFAGTESQVTPAIAAQLRYPLSKVGANGETYVLEPLAQLGWVGGNTLNVVNEESTFVEFDEGNLLALSRFPANDRRERGATAAVGVNWSRFSEDSWDAHFSLGQVYHWETQPDFTQSSGLSGKRSDLLVAGQIAMQNGFSFMARGLFDWDSGVDKAATRIAWTNDKLWLDASYIWLGSDLAENRNDTLSEWNIDTRYRLDRHWTALADWRYDTGTNQTAEAGVGLEYQNECVKIGLSLSRNFTTSNTVQPSTSIGLSIALLGFSVNAGDKSYSRTCKQSAG